MHSLRLFSTMLLAGGVALCAPSDDKVPQAPTPTAPVAVPTLRLTPPVLRNTDKEDTTRLVLPGVTTLPAPEKAETAEPAPPPPTPQPLPDPEKPVMKRAQIAYPPEFATESAIFCQKQIGDWDEVDAIEILGEPKRHRVSLNDQGVENGDIFAFTDPSSHYREIELDFDRESGTLRTVFAYPWKLTWVDCRKTWGAKVTAADADKGRTFYSYLDRRLDVLVDPSGKVISIGFY